MTTLPREKKPVTDARIAQLNKLIDANTWVVPGMGKVLWVNRLHFYKPTLRQVYGPSLLDVQNSLGVFIAYDRNTPKIYDTQVLIDEALNNVAEIEAALMNHAKGTNERYFEVYRAMFGLKRVTLNQVDEVGKFVRDQTGAKIPTRMAWYFKFDGFISFYPAYLEYLGAHPANVEPETGEVMDQHPDAPAPTEEPEDPRYSY